MFWFNFLLLLQCPNSKELHFPKLLKVIQFWISFWQFHSSYLKNCSKILKLFRFGSLYHYVPSHTSPKHPLPKDSLSRNLVRGISANEVGGCLHKDCTVEVKFHKVSAIGKGCKEKKKGHYGGDEQTNEYRLKSTQCGNFENISTAQFLREINFAYKYVPFWKFWRLWKWSVRPISRMVINSSSNLIDRKIVEFPHCEVPWRCYYVPYKFFVVMKVCFWPFCVLFQKNTKVAL